MIQEVGDGHFSERTRLRRFPEKGSHARADLDAILGAVFFGHLAMVMDGGSPFVIPTIFGCIGDYLYLHGSVASQSLRQGAKGVQVAFSVTVVDALVLARSVFEHSLNYRSAVVYSVAEEVTDPEEKLLGLKAISDHVAKGQWGYARVPSDLELKKTRLIRLDLDEFSVKVSSGPPDDSDSDDALLDIWAGVVPLSMVSDEPVPDPALRQGIVLPEHIREISPPGSSRR